MYICDCCGWHAGYPQPFTTEQLNVQYIASGTWLIGMSYLFGAIPSITLVTMLIALSTLVFCVHLDACNEGGPTAPHRTLLTLPFQNKFLLPNLNYLTVYLLLAPWQVSSPHVLLKAYPLSYFLFSESYLYLALFCTSMHCQGQFLLYSSERLISVVVNGYENCLCMYLLQSDNWNRKRYRTMPLGMRWIYLHN